MSMSASIIVILFSFHCSDYFMSCGTYMYFKRSEAKGPKL